MTSRTAVTKGHSVALVTGGSGGIGAAAARELALAGHHVAVGHRSGADRAAEVADQIAAAGGSASTVEIDVTNDASVLAAFERLDTDFGRPTVVVHAAGATKDRLLVRLSSRDWQDCIDLNLAGAFRVTQRAVRGMLRERRGRLVLVGSVVASTGSAGQAAYAAAKSGLVGLARSTAREVASRTITVNVVEPGPIATDMTAALDESRRDELAALVPMGRMGTPAEAAAVIAFLASDAAGFVTGAVVPVDGGLGLGR